MQLFFVRSSSHQARHPVEAGVILPAGDIAIGMTGFGQLHNRPVLIVSDFKHQSPALLQQGGGLLDDRAEAIQPVGPAVEGYTRLIAGDLRLQGIDLPGRDVGWVGDNEIERTPGEACSISTQSPATKATRSSK